MNACGPSPSRLHPDRAPGGDRDHRRPDRPAAAGGAGGARGGAADAVRQQPEAARPGAAQLPRRRGDIPDGLRRAEQVPAPVSRWGDRHGERMGLGGDDPAPARAGGPLQRGQFRSRGRGPARIRRWSGRWSPLTSVRPTRRAGLSRSTTAVRRRRTCSRPRPRRAMPRVSGATRPTRATGINNDGLGLGTGVMFRNSRIRLADITDGTSQTIAVVERAWSNASGLWAGAVTNGVIRRGPTNRCPTPTSGKLFYPAATLVQAHCHLINTNSDPDGGLDDCSSLHPGGANFLFADGSVHFLKSILGDAGTRSDGSPIYSPAGLVFQALATRAGGEVVSADSYWAATDSLLPGRFRTCKPSHHASIRQPCASQDPSVALGFSTRTDSAERPPSGDVDDLLQPTRRPVEEGTMTMRWLLVPTGTLATIACVLNAGLLLLPNDSSGKEPRSKKAAGPGNGSSGMNSTPSSPAQPTVAAEAGRSEIEFVPRPVQPPNLVPLSAAAQLGKDILFDVTLSNPRGLPAPPATFRRRASRGPVRSST